MFEAQEEKKCATSPNWPFPTPLQFTGWPVKIFSFIKSRSIVRCTGASTAIACANQRAAHSRNDSNRYSVTGIRSDLQPA